MFKNEKVITTLGGKQRKDSVENGLKADGILPGELKLTRKAKLLYNSRSHDANEDTTMYRMLSPGAYSACAAKSFAVEIYVCAIERDEKSLLEALAAEVEVVDVAEFPAFTEKILELVAVLISEFTFPNLDFISNCSEYENIPVSLLVWVLGFVVVSEETGTISVAKDGTLIMDVKEDALRQILIKNKEL